VEIHSFVVTPFQVNCYVAVDNGEAVVIDPGEATPLLLRQVAGFTVKAIVNTHGHADHCGANASLVNATGAPLACHAADLPLLQALEVQGQMFGLDVEPSPNPDWFLKDGDVIEFGKSALTVLHVPGHSPGHIALSGEGVLFAGDVLFSGSIGRTDLPGGNAEQLLNSIRTRLLTLPDTTKVYCGHGPSTTIGEERQHNPFLS
jgi:glyoxylase-like metal-dependent hydrolase (beta-lactamase superfamily II)